MIKEWIFFFFFFFARLFLNRNVTFATFVVEYYPAFFHVWNINSKKKNIYIYANIAMVINTWDKNREIFEKIFIRILKKRERERKTKIEDIPFTFEIVYRKINQTK